MNNESLIKHIVDTVRNKNSEYSNGHDAYKWAQQFLDERDRTISEQAQKIKEWKESENRLSCAYIRIRNLVGAFNTPKGPTGEQVWAHTEERIRNLLTKIQDYEEALNEIASWREGKTVSGSFDEPASAKIARKALAKHRSISENSKEPKVC